MSWNLDSAKTLGFTYNAAIVKDAYAGATYITNPQREATLYGSFFSWASRCPEEDFQTLEAWADSANGMLTKFKCFYEIPLAGLVCGDITWKAYIGEGNKLELVPFYLLERTPYIITSAIPTSSNLTILPDYTIPGIIGTQISVSFSFFIAMEDPEYKYVLEGDAVIFGDIPFRVMPVPKANI
jgi:hypothetical protein